MNSKLLDYNIGVAQGFKLSNKADRNLLNQNVAVAKSFEAVTKNELIKNVSNTYFNWFYNVQQYNLLLETDNLFADYEKYADKKFQVGETSKLEKINIKLLNPAEYRLRMISDENNNNTWDTGNYLLKRQAEKVSYYPEGIKVRANWDLEITLKTK